MRRRGGREFGRPGTTRSRTGRILITCEGERTEREYFLALRRSLGLTAVVVIARHRSNDPLGLVREVIMERRRLHDQARWENRDSAWVVLDGDEHIQNDPQNWHAALQLAEGSDIHLAVSNPCFELWYLLHLATTQAI